MIERGSGRTRGITDWQLMDVHSMWACLQDQDTTGQWKQVAGWRKICDLALAHLGRLREYRRGLAEAWPPETNAAARAYLGELDQLIDKVQRTHDTAAANYDALAAATRAIGSTRAELKPLHDEYVTKLKQKQAYEEIAADPKAVAGSRLPATSPVTDADLERLNVRARGLMSGLSGELQQAQAMLSKPPLPAVQRPGIETANPDVYGASPHPPIIPPVVPIPIVASDTVPALLRPGAPKSPAAASAAPGSGPVLGGAAPALAVPPAPAALASPLIPSTSAPIVGTGPVPPFSALTPRDGQARPANPQNERLGPIHKATTGGLPPDRLPHGMQPGGIIGGAPGMGLGQPGARATPPRRVNPLGGVIGGGGAGTAPSGAAGSRPGAGRNLTNLHGGPPFGGSANIPLTSNGLAGGLENSNRQRPRDETHQWDPDNPWETDKGVSPIVLPQDNDGPIDPGPAIGLDR